MIFFQQGLHDGNYTRMFVFSFYEPGYEYLNIEQL